MKRFLLFTIVLFALAGCKKGTTIVYRIINNSGEQVTVTSYYNYTIPTENSVVVNNGDTRDIIIMSKKDSKFEDNYTAGTYIDSIKAVTHTGKTLKKDLAAAANWQKVTTAKQNLHTFTAEIRPADIK